MTEQEQNKDEMLRTAAPLLLQALKAYVALDTATGSGHRVSQTLRDQCWELAMLAIDEAGQD